jgi:hypothetical protein
MLLVCLLHDVVSKERVREGLKGWKPKSARGALFDELGAATLADPLSLLPAEPRHGVWPRVAAGCSMDSDSGRSSPALGAGVDLSAPAPRRWYCLAKVLDGGGVAAATEEEADVLASKLTPAVVRECNSPALSLDALPPPGPDSPETSVHGAVVFRCVPASKQGGPCDHCATTGAWRAGGVGGGARAVSRRAHLRHALAASPRGLAPSPRWVGTASGLVSGRCRRAAAQRAPRAGTEAVLREQGP